jgi:dihydrofolate reductase
VAWAHAQEKLMRISLIVAMDRHGLIGNEQGLPWRLPADLRRFRKLTTGKPIIMGRKTLEQIGGPLKERLNIVLTRQTNFQHAGCVVAHSFPEAIEGAEEWLAKADVDEIMVIGGADVYRQALASVERIYLTIVDGEFTGNTWFNELRALRARAVHEETLPPDSKNPHPHRFLILERDDTAGTIEGILSVP